MKKYLGTMISCISLSLALLLFFSCATRKPQDLSDFESAPMYGMVYDYENQACADTLIIINEERETRSDINGRFIITDLLRGNHQITAKKEGYETISFSLYFTNRSQVLYIRMISFYQLLKNIENEIEAQNWYEVELLMARAEKIKTDDPIQQYLKAVYMNQTGQPENAIEILLNIIDQNIHLAQHSGGGGLVLAIQAVNPDILVSVVSNESTVVLFSVKPMLRSENSSDPGNRSQQVHNIAPLPVQGSVVGNNSQPLPFYKAQVVFQQVLESHLDVCSQHSG